MTSGIRTPRTLTLTTIIATTSMVVLMLLFASAADAKLYTHVKTTHLFGHDVNRTEVEKHGGREAEDTCVLGSIDTCQPGTSSKEPGGFSTPNSVAIGPESTGNDIYIADAANARVQVLAPNGEFLFMFGLEVDENTKANICTKASGHKCRVGQQGSGAAGELNFPTSVTVDQETGDIYVYERGGDGEHPRVDMFDPEGHFVWMIGGGVNKAKTLANAPEAERNACVAGEECQKAQEAGEGSKTHGTFRDLGGAVGDGIAIGGPVSKQLLYVGDQGRVQELDPATGAWAGEVPLAALPVPDGYVKALAVDHAGDLYVTAGKTPGGPGTGVSVLDPTGQLLRTIDPGGVVDGLALDPFGRLAVGEVSGEPELPRGVLFDASSGVELSTFQVTGDAGFAFNPDSIESKDELYAASNFQMVERLDPVPVAVPVTSACKNQTATSVTLAGEVNPENVSETKVRFLYGNAFGVVTPDQAVVTSEAFTPVEAILTGLRPNEAYPYMLAAEDENWNVASGNEPLLGEAKSCETPFVAPKPESEPASSNVGFSSAVMFGEVNPESARTKLGFEYGVCETLTACPGAQRTTAVESSEYATIAVMRSASELQPATTYHYRLYAESENRLHDQTASAYGTEGVFTTLPAPVPSVSTGPVSGVGASSAVLSGSVDPGGAGATWSFQVGVYNPSGTVFTTVVSGATSTQAESEEHEFSLGGLQPGTAYAYRVVIQSAYTPGGQPLAGETVLFTTQGLPVVLVAPVTLPLLAVPQIAFPVETVVGSSPRTVGCKKGLVRVRTGKCVAPRKTKKTRKPKRGKTIRRVGHKSDARKRRGGK